MTDLSIMVSFTSFQVYYTNVGPAAVEKTSGVDVLFFTYLNNTSYSSRNHLLTSRYEIRAPPHFFEQVFSKNQKISKKIFIRFDHAYRYLGRKKHSGDIFEKFK